MGIVIQVVMIFTFLTLFFFVYVVKVEKDEFSNQLNIIVDTIMTKQAGDPPSYISNITGVISKENLETVVLGTLEQSRRNQDIIDKAVDKLVSDQNEAVKNSSTKALLYVWGFLLLVILLLYIFGVCISLVQTIKETIVVVMFVALTEFIFLQAITSRYISASPNEVKRKIATSIQEWIKVNKMIPPS